MRSRSRGSSSDSDPPGRSSKGHKVKRSLKSVVDTSQDPSDGKVAISSELSRSDVEKIRNFTRTSSSHETGMSECSSSSHVSCPDPVKYNKSPVSYIEGEKEMVFSLAEEDEELLRENNGNDSSQNEQTTTNFKTSLKFTIGNSPEMGNLNNEAIHARILDDILNEHDSECTNIEATDYFEKSGLPDLSATSLSIDDDVEFVSSTPDFDRVSVSPSPSPKEKKSKLAKIKGRKHRLKPELSPPTKSAAAPELSSAVAVGIETTGSRLHRGRLSMPDIRTVRTAEPRTRLGRIDAHSESDIPGEVGSIPDSPGSPYVGNSLGARSGWSSSFDMEALDTVKPLQPSGPMDTVTIGRHKCE